MSGNLDIYIATIRRFQNKIHDLYIFLIGISVENLMNNY